MAAYPMVNMVNVNPPAQATNTVHLGANQTMSEAKANMDPEDVGRMLDRPRQFIGYPHFSRWMGSNADCVVLRRFDQVHARVLLELQNCIVMKERELVRIDNEHMDPTDPDPSKAYTNGSFYDDEMSPKGSNRNKRHLILRELRELIKEYDEMILNYRSLRSDPEPPARSVKNVKQYFENRSYTGTGNTGPVVDKECEYIHKEGDHLVLVPKKKEPLRRWLDQHGWFMLRPWFRKTPKGTQYYKDIYDTTRYQDEDRINSFITFFTLLLGLVLIIGPLQLLNWIPTPGEKLDAICGLIAGFTILMAVVMVTKPWETLGATAAYAAVLMVFLQINSNTKTGDSTSAGSTNGTVTNGTLTRMFDVRSLGG